MVACFGAQDGEPRGVVGEGKFDLEVKAPWAAEGGVKGVRAVGGADDDDLAAVGDAVYEG